ncbi:MAG: flagellar hook-basal body complex protein [Planctomycetaceae bacterium]
MANSLLTGFSGLQSHQKMIETVGHNLANLNTTGFKARRAAFSDVFYETVKGGSGGAVGALGGSNPAQIGNGSKLASIAVNFSQGSLEATGAEFDFALEGEGFFVLNSENGQHYTRAGAFAVDQHGNLVDAATGYQVQRYGTIGETAALGPAFQTQGSPSIKIPIGANVPGQATSVVNVRGNLSPDNQIFIRQVLSTVDPLLEGGLPATPATLLNDLDIVTVDYIATDTIQLTGTNHDGTALNATVAVGPATTLQDLIDGINAQLGGATASLGADGRLVVEADTAGASVLDFTISDSVGNTGSAGYNLDPLTITKAGVDGDKVRGGMEVFDEQGGIHVVGIELYKLEDGTWRLDASMDASEGTLIDSVIEGIQLNSDGSFQAAGIIGPGDANLEFQFAGVANPQTVRINFGDPGTFTALTSIAVASNLAADQDGFATGSMVGVHIDESGVVEGIASNGRRFPLAQLAVAMFRNPNGLESQGNNLFRSTSSSGTVEMGSARTTGRGSILAGQLEQSNVDIATEFTRLIIAQRGFSANARTITVTDQILEELTSLLR